MSSRKSPRSPPHVEDYLDNARFKHNEEDSPPIESRLILTLDSNKIEFLKSNGEQEGLAVDLFRRQRLARRSGRSVFFAHDGISREKITPSPRVTPARPPPSRLVTTPGRPTPPVRQAKKRRVATHANRVADSDGDAAKPSLSTWRIARAARARAHIPGQMSKTTT